MIATISKDFQFSASHVLAGLPDCHPCARLHGHNYIVRIELTGEVVEPGFVLDYAELGLVKNFLDERFDHRHLNEAVPVNPTAENLASHIMEELLVPALEQLSATNVTAARVSVSETPKTWASTTCTLGPGTVSADA